VNPLLKQRARAFSAPLCVSTQAENALAALKKMPVFRSRANLFFFGTVRLDEI
jgi:hypothetical protein